MRMLEKCRNNNYDIPLTSPRIDGGKSFLSSHSDPGEHSNVEMKNFLPFD